MKRVNVLDELADNYEDEFGCSDQCDSVSAGVNHLISNMINENPSEENLEHKLVLRSDLCSFPELDYDGRGLVGKENHLIVDPNPLFSRIQKKRSEKDNAPLPCNKRYEMNTILSFLSNAIPESSFFRNIKDYDSYLSSSSRGFFFDNPNHTVFNISDCPGLIEEQIHSLSDKSVLKTAFQNPLYRYNTDLDEDVIEDIVKETILTYFSRLELNSEVDRAVNIYTPKMVNKLFSKNIRDSSDVELIVSQLFVAHDWLCDKREEWLKSPDRYATIFGEEINTSEYLDGGAQMLLMEIVPENVKTNNDLRDYPFSQDIRMIHEKEFFKEGNYAQATDLGDQIRYFVERKEKENLDLLAYRARLYLNEYLVKLPVIVAKYQEHHSSIFD